MLKYLIIQLDDASTSFCHYDNEKKPHNLIPLEILREGIIWAMKENLILQILYPDNEIPNEYKLAISKTFHADIVSSTCEDNELLCKADVVVFNSLINASSFPFNKEQSYVFRVKFSELINNIEIINSIISKVNRINIVITDILSFHKDDEIKYAKYLENLSDIVTEEYKLGHNIQINILTDRLLLDNMNNCNAGNEAVSLCPDGCFYVCPAFYSTKDLFNLGNLKDGVLIKNPQLYKLENAPICKICDAYQCRRCIWLNQQATLEINTPSHEQCVIAHIERDASRNLLKKIREIGQFLPDKEIRELKYLDPLDKILRLI